MNEDLLLNELVTAFGTPAQLDAWVQVQYPAHNVFTILEGARLDLRIHSLLTWAKSEAPLRELLQRIADHPPGQSQRIQHIIHALTGGEVRPSGSPFPPVEPHADWFVARRPFVNRRDLRQILAQLDKAPAGPDSVLVINGEPHSGKTHSVLFAVQCAPEDRRIALDTRDWEDVQMTAADLAHALGDSLARIAFPSYDPTKEDEAVPRLRQWLVTCLKNSNTWILVDHCNRANLTRPAFNLLVSLAGQIERGFLPGVRLVLADVERTKLPGRLPKMCRCDTAMLPDQACVKEWSQTLAAHMGKQVADAQAEAWASAIFSRMDPALSSLEKAERIEEELSALRETINALP